VDDFDLDLDLDLGFVLELGFALDLGLALDLCFEAWRAFFAFGRPAFTPLSLVGPAAPAGTIK
jgi:hypothetical protein